MNWLDAAPFIERLALGLLGGAVVWWSAIDLGALAFAAIGIKERERSVEAAALGYALVGSVVGLLGLVHALGLAAIVALVIVQFVARCVRERRLPFPTPAESFHAWTSLRALDKAATIATAFAWITATVAAALPATWWDPIAYHLPIAARALAQHAFVADPGMVQTTFVLLGEAAAVPAYAIGGSAGAAMAVLGSGIVLSLLCGLWAERIAAGSGRIATALVSCSALWLWLAPSFYVDVPFAMFAIAALMLATAPGDKPSRMGFTIAAGALAGAAAATKYTGLAAVALALVVVYATAQRGAKAPASAGFVLAALALAGGWYARTALATGDPVFPFLSAHGSSAVAEFAQRYVTMTRSWCGAGTSASDALALPWRLLTSPRSFCGDPGYALDLGAIFVLASLAAFRRVALPLALCAVLTAIWFFSSQQLRFLVPAVCLFAIVAAVGTVVVSANLRALGQTALVAACFVGVAVDWIPGRLDASNSVAPSFSYVAGVKSGDDYLSSRLEFYDAVRWIGRQGDGPVAALDDVRDYYFGASARWLNPYYQQTAIDWSAPSDVRYATLVAAGYRYLVVNANSAYVKRTPTGVDWRALYRDVGRGTLRPAFSREGVTVFEFGPKAREGAH